MSAFGRLVAFCIVVSAPFLFLAILSGQAEGALFLIYPIAAIIPAYFLVFLFFVPTEKIIEFAGGNHLKNVLVPLVGGFAGVLLKLLYSWRFKEQLINLDIWIVAAFAIGMALGIAWRLSEILARRFGWLQ